MEEKGREGKEPFEEQLRRFTRVELFVLRETKRSEKKKE